MKHKCLTLNDRYKIEGMLLSKTPKTEIARLLGVHHSTIYREIKRGQYLHRNSDWTTEMRYSATIAHDKFRANMKCKGPALKIGKDLAYAQYLEYLVGEKKRAPGAALGEIKHKGLKFNTTISKTTFYRYIENGVFLTLTNDNLPIKRNKTKKRRTVKRAARATAGVSIEKRPEHIDSREEFGHWEMDCVVGGKNTSKVLLVLTERKSRKEIIRLMPDKTAASVVSTLNNIEKQMGSSMFKKIFKSITMDNGCEFTDVSGMETSVKKTKTKRTNLYFCHPYCAHERGSNENCNRLVRRHYPKGVSFDNVSPAEIKKLENWINEYPRQIFDFCTANEIFKYCLDNMAA